MKQKKSKAKKSPLKKIVDKGVKAVTGNKAKEPTKRRAKGVNYWANKVLVTRLKKKYFSLKYGGLR